MNIIDINHAKELYRSKNHKEFVEYCLSFDEIEDGDTLDSIGICFANGKGVDKNIKKAIIRNYKPTS